MLRVHLMQKRFALRPSAMEEALYEIASLSDVGRPSLGELILDETTIGGQGTSATPRGAARLLASSC